MSDQAIVVVVVGVIFIFIGCISVWYIIYDRNERRKNRKKALGIHGKPKQ